MSKEAAGSTLHLRSRRFAFGLHLDDMATGIYHDAKDYDTNNSGTFDGMQ
jgi:hypothetical protein